ncbi:autotransporter domain-containing protein [Sphingomonas sp. DG1-23]|uniref:autotransporter domain-containing protein n=1 Tax=Sphingomonas sp. DG1-23 TaxID=3068316 RepID=UPI00273E957C|nr:autotransporter domain-containing protein [Sphingomonas sp. DG1-23]MDP5277506.1 autotransporter domain-containing protein [Sphingomonas sp. DG1-23]
MTGYCSHAAPPGAQRSHRRGRSATRMAALAASVSFAAIASPAFAQCVEGPPANFTCSGQTDVPQVIIADDATVTTDLDFVVDTTNNGNGLALQVTGDGLISFNGSPELTGAGARFTTSGASGASVGELAISSSGRIFANGSNGLSLDNLGGGATSAFWSGAIANSGGSGILARNFAGSGELFLLVGKVSARDDGIVVEHSGNGVATISATVEVVAHLGTAIQATLDGGATDLDLTADEVIGGSYGILVNHDGTGVAKVDATGTVTGLNDSGISVQAGASATGINIRATQVNGLVSGIEVTNQGIGDTLIAASGAVAGEGNGILAVNGTTAHDISIGATDVSGFYGIRTFNQGTGATSINTTGLVEGTDYGIIAQNVVGSTDMNIRAANVAANGNGIEVENFGSGTTNVVVDTVTGLGDVGVRITTANSAGSVDLTVGDVTGGEAGAVISNGGIGAARLTATGTVTGANSIGINVGNGVNATDLEIHAHNVNAGSYFGVLGLNEGTGDTLIETTGLVAVDDIYGIIGLNEATARNMTVSAVDVIAGRGLSITNFGTGTTDVVSTGTITGYSAEGVVVGTKGAATDLRVDVNVVNGNTGGMRISNQGIGSTSIRAGGTVSAATGYGIDAAIGATALDVAVDVVDVTGTSGIVVDNQGTGTTRIAATGTVTGTTGAGINVLAYTLNDGVEIDVADVTGSTTGVNVTNYAGPTTITASGTVSALAADGFGIVVATGTGSTDIRIVAADVLGNAGGIYTENLGSGETAITSTGTVTGGFSSGIFARNDAGAADLTISANNVLGAEDGIATEHVGTGTTNITAAKATGQTGAGVRVDASGTAGAVNVAIGDASGGDYGVLVSNFGTGTTNVETTGIVAGIGDGGIAIENGGATTGIALRAAQVSGETYGIAVQNGGTGNTSVVATGLVTGAGDGMIVRNDAMASDLVIDVAAVQGGSTGIFAVNHGIGRTSVRSSGDVTGDGPAGIDVRADTATLDVTVDVTSVTGGNGITVQNFGQGAASVAASGTVTGTFATGTGIAVVGGTGSTDLRVAAVDVAGGTRGIGTVNDGTGGTLIATTGLVSGAEAGILARNGAGATDLIIRASQIQSAGAGIAADNLGSGGTQVLAGAVTAGSGTGIRAFASTAAGDVAIEAASVSAGEHGIRVDNSGLGATSITATGPVTAGEFGIYAESLFSATDLTIRAGQVQGGGFGIGANNLGSGDTMVVATGKVSGVSEVGILLGAGPDSTSLTVLAADVSGGLGGIRADNYGLGAAMIETTKLVSGGDFGIRAENAASATDLTIRATDVQAVGNAISAENLGTGETRVIATGSVVTQTNDGIRVRAGAGSGDILVEAASASGGLSGISTINNGLGDTSITVTGVVQGGNRGVMAVSDTAQDATILNTGTIRNASGWGSDEAIRVTGGSTGIGNSGTLIGTLALSGGNSVVVNTGSWQSIGGSSSFTTVDDQLLNATPGTIISGLSAATAETTRWQGLERFQNSGLLRLQDGGVGDVLQTSAATTFANGAVLAVDIAGLNGADSFRTTGKVQIDAGSRLQVAVTQPLVLHGKYVVVQADGGLTGQFLFEDQLVTAFAGVRDGYTATTAFLEFAQMKAFAAAGLTPNQKETGAGADSLHDGNALKDALLLLPTDAAAQDAFDQLSGEIHPSGRNAMVADSRLVRGAVLDRLVDAGESALWGRLFGTSGISDGDYNAAALDRDTKGGVVGLDRSFGAVTLGLAGGWSNTDLRVARRNSSGSIGSIHGMVYAGARLGGFGLRGGAGYARTTTETTRRIAFQGFSATTTADYHGSVLQGFVEAGYRLPVGGGHVEPFVSLSAIRARTDAFTETGGIAALSGAAISETTMSGMTGVRFETSPAGAFSLRGTAGWRHGRGDLDPVGRHTFAGGTPFTVLGTAGAKDAGALNVEARYRLSPNVTLSVGYDGVLGAGNADHAITGAFKIVF